MAADEYFRLKDLIGRGGPVQPPPAEYVNIFDSPWADRVRAGTRAIGRGTMADPMDALREAILSSDLPRSSQLVQALTSPEAPAVHPIMGWMDAYGRKAKATDINPDLLHQTMNRYGSFADEFPESVNSIAQIRPEGGQLPGGFRPYASVTPVSSAPYRAGIGVSDMTPEVFRARVNEGSLIGHFPGLSTDMFGETRPVFSDPLALNTSHEFGHILQHRLGEFLRTGGDKAAASDYLDRVILDNLKLGSAYSDYSFKGTREALGKLATEERNPRRYGIFQDLLGKVEGKANPEVTAADLKKLGLHERFALAAEPVSEGFSAVRAPLRAPIAGEVLTPSTARAMAGGKEFEGVLDTARAAGMRGAISPELLGKLGLELPAWLVAEHLAGKIPNKHTRSLAKGALTGAGIGSTVGSIIPGVGTLAGGAAGAGIGALAAQIF